MFCFPQERRALVDRGVLPEAFRGPSQPPHSRKSNAGDNNNNVIIVSNFITNHQVASEIDGEQRKELEHMILELEAENANLKEEYNHLKIVGASQMGPMSTNQPEVILLCIFHPHHPYHR